MKVKVLGSSSMWSPYNSASYLIDEKILIDVPNGITKALRRYDINISKIENVLITHFHGDHYFDIPFFLFGKTKFEYQKLNICCDLIGRYKIFRLIRLAFPFSFFTINRKVKVKYIYNTNFKIDNYKVKKLHVKHGTIKPTYGYVFTDDNISFGFTGDSSLCESIYDMCKICNAIICDCSFKVGDNRHMGIDNILKLSKMFPDVKFYTSHMGDITRKKLETLNVSNIVVLNDGDEIVL